MKLTRKESLHNLKVIITKGGNDDEFLRIYPDFQYEINYMITLIDKHFDNPPLKFEELKKGMWVWDNKNKCYFECEPAISTDMAECVTYTSFWYNTGEDEDEFFEEYEEFEENRFYRKQVEE